MKYAPKKVFILENGLYKEITYSELKQLEQADKSYMDKFFLPLHGMLKKDIEILDKNIITIFEQIKTDIFQTRGKVLSDANRELLSMYFRIGKLIVENSKYGNNFINELSNK